MKRRKCIVIGGNVAGITAASNARKTDASAEIVVLSKEPYPPYRRSLLPSVVMTQIPGLDFSSFSSWINELRIHFQPNVEVLDINPDERIVNARNVETKKTSDLHYDNLILATGALVPIPRVEGAEKKGVFVFRTFEDALKISREAKAGKNAVVVGGGFVSLKVAESLAKRGMKVTIAVRSRILRKLVEPSLSEHLEKQIEQRGVKVMNEVSPKEIGGKEKVEYIMLDGEKIPASIVVFATGAEPNVKLAEKAGIELGETGAIKVNRRMQTSIPEIFAAGNCAETLDALMGRWTYFPLGIVAAEEGIIAGRNAAGEEIEMGGIVRVQMDMLFENGVVSMGYTSELAREISIPVNTVELSPTLKRYAAKIIAVIDQKRRMIGAQICSRSASTCAFHAANLLSAIRKHMTLNDFLKSPIFPPLSLGQC